MRISIGHCGKCGVGPRVGGGGGGGWGGGGVYQGYRGGRTFEGFGLPDQGDVAASLAENRYLECEALFGQIVSEVTPLLSGSELQRVLDSGAETLSELRSTLDQVKAYSAATGYTANIGLWGSWNNAAQVTFISWQEALRLVRAQAEKAEVLKWLKAAEDARKELTPDLDLGWLKWAVGIGIVIMAFNASKR